MARISRVLPFEPQPLESRRADSAQRTGRFDLVVPLVVTAIALAGIAWMAWSAHSRGADSEGANAVADDASRPVEIDRPPAPERVTPPARQERPTVSPAVPAPSVAAAPSAAIATTPAPTSAPSGVDEHPELDAVLDQIEFPEGDAGTPGQQLHRANENYQRLRARMTEMDRSLQAAERSGDVAAQQRIVARFRRMRTVMLSLQSEASELREQGAVDPTVADAEAPASHGG
jgi:hypothetical protein